MFAVLFLDLKDWSNFSTENAHKKKETRAEPESRDERTTASLDQADGGTYLVESDDEEMEMIQLALALSSSELNCPPWSQGGGDESSYPSTHRVGGEDPNLNHNPRHSTSDAEVPSSAETFPPPVPPRNHVRTSDQTDRHLDTWNMTLIDAPLGSTKSLASLCQSTSNLLSRYPHTDQISNSGVVWGRVSPINPVLLQDVKITVNVSTVWSPHLLPIPTFLTTTVQSLIDQVMLLMDQTPPDFGLCLLKLCDSDEYLRNEEMLGLHESILTYHQFALEVPVRLLHTSILQNLLSRDAEDHRAPCNLYGLIEAPVVSSTFRLRLQVQLSCYTSKVNTLLRTMCGTDASALVEEVHRLISLLFGITTEDLDQAVGNLLRIKPTFLDNSEMYECETALLMLHQALGKLLHAFFDSFSYDYRNQYVFHSLPVHDVNQNNDILQLKVTALYGLQPNWLYSFDYFSISWSLTSGGKNICERGHSENISTALSLGNKIRCNRMMVFPVRICRLPYESMLSITLHGSKQGKSPELLRWAVLPLYRNKTLVSGTVLVCMSTQVMHSDPPSPALSDSHSQALTDSHDGVIMQLETPETAIWRYCRPESQPGSVLYSPPFDEVHRKISEATQKHCVCFLSENEKAFLWSKRRSCDEANTSLHLLLGGAPDWGPEKLPEIYPIVENWTFHQPEEALFLLGNSFHDQVVREKAVNYLQLLTDEDLEDYLPQLVQVNIQGKCTCNVVFMHVVYVVYMWLIGQALKSEWELDGPLVMMLLDRSIKDVRIAQQFYWLLVDSQNDAHYQSWFSKIQAALKHCLGRALRQELEQQEVLVSLVTQVAVDVRTAEKSQRKNVLAREKRKIDDFFENGISCRLPLDPAVLVRGVNMEACKFYSSHTAPLGISFINMDPVGRDIGVICKTGDNLRQDMLVLQMVRVMDRVWLREALDMRMITYRCLSTGTDQGLVEVVPEAVTLGKIQQEWGLGGTLREDTLEKWFRMWNKTDEDYEEAVINFLHSCAGWCVVTFILGICDRHNDNIMLKHRGHMFHIDFGKIMGNAQKFGSIKRDRTPFIFTSEMQHFITGGGQNPERFHRFVELCCNAYNSIRRHIALVLSLLQLMLGAGMPEMKDIQDLKYVLNKLRPLDSDMEATSYFTEKIKESMDSFPVKLNFLFHNLAQSSRKKMTPPIPGQSSSPNRNIREAYIDSYKGKGKDLTFELRVAIEDGYLIREKTFGQLELIHKELQKHFIESTLPEFPKRYWMSFTPGRKMATLNKYLVELFQGPCKGNEFVCRLFLDGPKSSNPRSVASDQGAEPQIQLYITYMDKKLSVLIKHLKNIKLANGSCPDVYVVTRLNPGSRKKTKRKTKVVRNNHNPTFNELMEYEDLYSLQGRVLEVMVKSRKTFVAAAVVQLEPKNMDKEMWFHLVDARPRSYSPG
ncbi:hypothetical protein DPEC_G00160580 [Dallia pectoralis]|uniref:Uncharacterized protein n=1 Tax=Dallia pectoralis TaxID=75939 RepID=A0ACC2GGG9_DALPE|nr:hypothetical protein DPEC_G00160580 [Dallia pectoralis]